MDIVIFIEQHLTGTKQMIIETSCNHFYRVTETGCEALDHVWYGVPVKRAKGDWVITAKARRTGKMELVRKAATRVVEA